LSFKIQNLESCSEKSFSFYHAWTFQIFISFARVSVTLSESVSFSRLSRFARKTDFTVTIRASFFSAATQILLTRHKQPSVTHVRTRRSERKRYMKEGGNESEWGMNVFSRKRIPWEHGESRQELDFVKRRRSIRVWGWSSMRWEGGGEITSMDRGMKRSSQIFTVSGWNEVSLSLSLSLFLSLSLGHARVLQRMNYCRET